MPNLVCPHCGGDKWEPYSSTTLLFGPVNYHTYTCADCGKSTKVKRVDKSMMPHSIDLGPEDEVVKRDD